ncbi:MAG TPA: L,D-transpeptidase [Gemmatimonadaceae bacterium]|nr:L,D-transpeptidase [Gemmatimonadaceae bacterium]
MQSLRLSRFALVVTSALAVSLPAAAQQPVSATQSTTDSLPVTVDSMPRHNWVMNVIRKVTFRGDERTAADSAATTATADSTAAAARVHPTFDSRRERLEYESARKAAEEATGFHIVVDVENHHLYVINDGDTLRSASAATASNETLRYGNKTWHFETPRGVRTVLRKDKEPTWTPPEWHYAEVANEYGLKLRYLQRGERVRVRGGTILTTQGDEVGVIQPGSTEFIPLVLDEHIVFDNTLFIPPAGTKHRTIQGELGHYRLALGDGYQIHGTPDKSSIGSSVTHGCVRLHDDDIEWLYDNVPVGTKVYLY